jgi:hypothetical protein
LKPFPKIILNESKTQEEIDRADKHEWREREGWSSAEEALITLSGKDGSHFELIEE